ncbi:DUF5995 family protein [Streptomyces sp. SL13]|jgi:hypothetical protein|uniref:DUF5995 family protein n=1 Tax=Streptantibioticus silvisoli TaxID=2705255 RepID=A0AA90KAB6_9ACTN|nr:DUF5995 family protein [Streptantibioticus silvisoli]MDI5964734.1 DUF5995 family protein [Streptantibioticus silvisoli]MDI5972208.1 DUF5995 family protein [Streptantibioticus silvisoli]
MTSSERLVPASSRVAAVAARMRALSAGLPDRDGVAVFNRVYLSVTRELTRRVDEGWFRHPHRTAELGAAFALRYLSAVEADAEGRRAPACWRPLFAARHHRAVRPLQFALAGVNAHVGHDLALAVVDTCHLLGLQPADVERDFERVGDVLAAIEERVREELMPGPDLLELADPLTHLAGVWSLDAARTAAWSAAGLLWRLRELPGLYAEFAHGLDTGVGLVNRCLLTPL